MKDADFYASEGERLEAAGSQVVGSQIAFAPDARGAHSGWIWLAPAKDMKRQIQTYPL